MEGQGDKKIEKFSQESLFYGSINGEYFNLRLGKAMVESVAIYGCEVWFLKSGKEEERKFLDLEISGSARVFKLIAPMSSKLIRFKQKV